MSHFILLLLQLSCPHFLVLLLPERSCCETCYHPAAAAAAAASATAVQKLVEAVGLLTTAQEQLVALHTQLKEGCSSGAV